MKEETLTRIPNHPFQELDTPVSELLQTGTGGQRGSPESLLPQDVHDAVDDAVGDRGFVPDWAYEYSYTC